MGKAVKAAAAPMIARLAQADAAAAALVTKYLEARDRLQQARQEHAAAMSRRDALVNRAKGGEIIDSTEVVQVEGEIRAADSSVVLLTSAMAAMLKQIEAAEHEVGRLACLPKEAECRAAIQRYDAAVEAHCKAAAERNAAFQEAEMARVWLASGAGVAAEIDAHAPASHSRRNVIKALLEADAKAEAERRARLAEQQRRERREEAIEDFKAQNRARGWPEDAGLGAFMAEAAHAAR